LFEADFAADLKAAAARVKIILDALQAAQHATGGKIGSFDMLHQLSQSDAWIINLGTDPVDDFAEIVRRDVRGHADRDASAAIDEQIGESGREDSGFGASLIVIRNEIHRILFHVLHEYCTERR